MTVIDSCDVDIKDGFRINNYYGCALCVCQHHITTFHALSVPQHHCIANLLLIRAEYRDRSLTYPSVASHHIVMKQCNACMPWPQIINTFAHVQCNTGHSLCTLHSAPHLVMKHCEWEYSSQKKFQMIIYLFHSNFFKPNRAMCIIASLLFPVARVKRSPSPIPVNRQRGSSDHEKYTHLDYIGDEEKWNRRPNILTSKSTLQSIVVWLGTCTCTSVRSVYWLGVCKCTSVRSIYRIVGKFRGVPNFVTFVTICQVTKFNTHRI